jgi:hypothetical protein
MKTIRLEDTKFKRINLYELYSTVTFFSCVIIYTVLEKVMSNKEFFLTFTVPAIWQRTAWYMFTDVSVERTASTVRVGEIAML